MFIYDIFPINKSHKEPNQGRKPTSSRPPFSPHPSPSDPPTLLVELGVLLLLPHVILKNHPCPLYVQTRVDFQASSVEAYSEFMGKGAAVHSYHHLRRPQKSVVDQGVFWIGVDCSWGYSEGQNQDSAGVEKLVPHPCLKGTASVEG